jgi:hypothetical protein
MTNGRTQTDRRIMMDRKNHDTDRRIIISGRRSRPTGGS